MALPPVFFSARILHMTDQATVGQLPRVRVFIDFWNFQLILNEREAKKRNVRDFRFEVDWKIVGPWLARKACAAIGLTEHSFDGVIVYTSHDGRTEEGSKFHKWATGWLDRQAGVTVECLERKPKAPPKCPACHETIITCPHCSQTIRAMHEKGVDTLLVTDMIRLAWEEAYDLAVLASSDRDLIPAVNFLSQKGRKIVHAGFPPAGSELSAACWASFDVFPSAKEIARAGTATAGK